MLVSLNGPIHDLSDSYLFSVHMGQHLLLTLVLPPLLLAGVPGWLIEPAVRRPVFRAVARVLTHPVVAGVLFSAILLVWHTVPAYDLMMRDHDVHVATHLLFMAGAVMLWWPVMSPTPLLPRLGPGWDALSLPGAASHAAARRDHHLRRRPALHLVPVGAPHLGPLPAR